ncbi:ABC transporter substrate-binding protein [Bordetella sp. LUAb4]|uniref:ABC transporter substrate-binding protein n=1 Tax=Bordetella sp. LUAb4 TaxID=2843195 RepID=UPI001E496A6C|nr:ABC transporter substrate-binding protein [Bordetella sp. LUAb4]
MVSPLRRALLKAAVLATASGSLATHGRNSLAAEGTKVTLLAGNKGSTSALYPLLLNAKEIDTSGLDIEYIGSAPGQMQLQLLSGALNFSGYGALGVVEANQKGADFRLVAPFDLNHSSWIVRADSPYKTIHDLKGKRVATLPINTDTVRQAELTAALHGLNLKQDFQMSYGLALVSLALFERGDADAIIAIEPNSTRLVAKGAREIAKVGDLWREATGDESLFLVGWASSNAWLKRNSAAAKTIAKAYYDINRLIVQKPDIIAQPAFLDALGVPANETKAIELLPRRIAAITSVQWNDSVARNIDKQLDLAIKHGLLASRPGAPIFSQEYVA